MTEPAKYDEKLIPAVDLVGKKWPIPELGVRQLREVRVPLLKLSALLKIDFDQALNDLSKEDYENLVIEVVYQGLTRAHPELEREEFLDMAIGGIDMMAAWLVVRRQSGLFSFVAKTEGEGSEGDKPPGEAAAAE